jgi:hypothetical protein
MSVIVQLELEEVRVCTMIAMERWILKKGSIDKPNYAAGKRFGALEHELLANIRANVAEYAVAKYYELPWTFPWYPNGEHKKRKDHPDVGTNLEVRTVRTQTSIPVWSKDVAKNAIIIGCKVLDDDYFTQVEIYGWFPANSANRLEWRDPKIGGHRIPIAEFREGYGEE